MVDKIKKDIILKKGQFFEFKVNNIRNKCDIFEGVISEVYDRVFVVKTKDGNTISFTYSDILIGNVEIHKKMCWHF